MVLLVTLVAAEVGRKKLTVVKPQRILYVHSLLFLKLLQIILSLKPRSTTWHVLFKVRNNILYNFSYLPRGDMLVSTHPTWLNNSTENHANFVKSTSYESPQYVICPLSYSISPMHKRVQSFKICVLYVWHVSTLWNCTFSIKNICAFLIVFSIIRDFFLKGINWLVFGMEAKCVYF